MGLIRDLPEEIRVIFEPDEVLTEVVGFKANTVAPIASAIAFAARQKLAGTRLEHVFTDVTKVSFEQGKFVVSMSKKRGL